MSILIKGMEMPTEGMVITIYKLNGKFYASVHGTELCPLVSVPPHGRMIDADKVIATHKVGNWDLHKVLAEAPTIIEAEE